MAGKRPGAPPQRLQKILAAMGLGSRREIERWIAAGEVTVNGRVATVGTSAAPGDRVTVRGRPVNLAKAPSIQVLAYHKPEGEVVARSDPEGRPTVFERLPKPARGRWIAIGRLDLNTSGLLLLTTDGALANTLMHPSAQIEREYAVRVRGEIDEALIRRLVSGVTLEDGPARFEDVVYSGGEGLNHWFHVVLCEGRKREVRRLWESQGVVVSRLKRARFANVTISGLRPGTSRELTADEIASLRGYVSARAKISPDAAAAD
ncbi:MAG: rRNA pseudouridine synthase [Chromatiales bacterium]|nr:rRNA pseudouridine synthase [Chromatiales bacterium]